MGNKILDACVLPTLQQYPDCGKIRHNHINIQTYIKKVPLFERLGLNINAELKYINSQNLVWLCRPQSLITGKTKHSHLNFLRKFNDHLEGQHIHWKNNLSILKFNKSCSIGGWQETWWFNPLLNAAAGRLGR